MGEVEERYRRESEGSVKSRECPICPWQGVIRTDRRGSKENNNKIHDKEVLSE